MRLIRISFILLAVCGLNLLHAAGPEKSVGHNSKLVSDKARANSFSSLEKILQQITDEASLAIFEGLPHQDSQSKLYKRELKSKPAVTRYGYSFYEPSVAVSGKEKDQLLKLLKKPGAFRKYGGRKFCGGFHPDYSLHWKTASGEVEMHLCFGCHEMRVYSGDLEVHADMGESTPEALKKLLNPFQNNRPIAE